MQFIIQIFPSSNFKRTQERSRQFSPSKQSFPQKSMIISFFGYRVIKKTLKRMPGGVLFSLAILKPANRLLAFITFCGKVVFNPQRTFYLNIVHDNNILRFSRIPISFWMFLFKVITDWNCFRNCRITENIAYVRDSTLRF